MVIRNSFKLKKFDSLAKIKEKIKLFFIGELRFYELFKLVIKILGRESEYFDVNKFITEEGVSKLQNGTSGLKILRNREKLTSKNKRKIENRVRLLFNKCVQLDKSILISLMRCKKEGLDELLHDFRDLYICDNDHLLSLFW